MARRRNRSVDAAYIPVASNAGDLAAMASAYATFGDAVSGIGGDIKRTFISLTTIVPDICNTATIEAEFKECYAQVFGDTWFMGGNYDNIFYQAL